MKKRIVASELVARVQKLLMKADGDKKDYGKGKRMQLVTVNRKGKTFQALRLVGKKDDKKVSPKKEQQKKPVSITESPEFKSWFGDSKVTDESGKPLVVYRGDFRADKIGTTPKISKVTSGRFYFTSDPDVASKYAEDKVYRDEQQQDFENWFTFPQLKHKGERNAPNLHQAWYRLSEDQKKRVADVMLKVGYDEQGNLDFSGKNRFADEDTWKYNLRQAQGNWLMAAKETILMSGSMFDNERSFVDILKHAGINAEYDSPDDSRSGVMPVYLRIEKPVDTSDEALLKKLHSELSAEFKSDKSRAKEYGSDQWDKTLRTPKSWLQLLGEDIAAGTTHAWTTIPEKITKALQAKGFDGVKDTGGKNSGVKHTVWIAFEPNQIKSKFNNGKFSRDSDNILKSMKDRANNLLIKAQG
jgi:hypothetical protein